MEAQLHKLEEKQPPETRTAVTSNECVINAENCRIKAEQQRSMRDLYLSQAACWDQLAKKLW